MLVQLGANLTGIRGGGEEKLKPFSVMGDRLGLAFCHFVFQSMLDSFLDLPERL